MYIQGGMKNCSGKDYCGNKAEREVEENTKSREGQGCVCVYVCVCV